MEIFSLDFLYFYLSGLLFGIAFFLSAWPISIKMKKANIIDVYWGYSFIFYFAFYSILSPQTLSIPRYFLLAVCLIWCFRLGTYLLIRTVNEEHEDARYTEIKKDWGVTDKGFWPMFIFQGFLSWSVSICFAVIAVSPTHTLLFYTGGALSLLALIGESIADKQLAAFKKNPDNRGTTCRVGLWFYSRHPNYFFEWLVWVGFFIASIGQKAGFLSLVSVLIMYRFLTKVSGAGFSEEIMLKSNKRPDYPEYVRVTNAFFPWFPKK